MIMPTYNSFRTINKCLESINKQDYKGKVEVIVIDGGSTDGTIEVVKKYKHRVIKENSGSPETAKAIGLKEAAGELILLMASDNVLPNKSWLTTMVLSLEKEPGAVAAYPGRYAYSKNDNSLNRYFSLMGANDPLAWFMGKADRQSYLVSKSQKTKLVEFNEKNMPTLGDNGMLVWREKLLKAKVDEKHFSHMDVFYDLIVLGMTQFVVVEESMIHDTGEEWFRFLKKRYKYMKELYLKKQEMRRYKWVRNYLDVVKIGIFIIYSFSVIGPLLTAGRGFLRKPDLAWLWHPVMCLGLTLGYTLAML